METAARNRRRELNVGNYEPLKLSPSGSSNNSSSGGATAAPPVAKVTCYLIRGQSRVHLSGELEVILLVVNDTKKNKEES